MKTTLDEIDQSIAILKSIQPIQAEYKQKLDKKFRLEINFNSNHLEGNTLTYSETELLLLFDDAKGEHTLREYEEMKAHDVAYELINQWANDSEHTLTEQDIKNLNEIILVRPFWKEAITPDGQQTRRLIKVGDYKEFPNSVRLQNGEIFEYTSPTDTPIQMHELIEWYRSEQPALHPVTLAAIFHYKFVRIHPFDDGNGRISRLLMNYVLLKEGFPPIVIKSKDKQDYLRALHIADVGDYEPFISFISDQVLWSINITLKAASGQNIEERDDLDKEISIFKKSITYRHGEIVKDKEVIKELWQNSLKYLCNEFIKMCDKFGELFNRFNIDLLISLGNRNIKKDSKNEMTKFITTDQNRDSITGVIFVAYFKDLIRFGYNSSLQCEITFSDITYTIRFYTVMEKTFKYDDSLKNAEIDHIITDAGKQFMNEIKTHARTE